MSIFKNNGYELQNSWQPTGNTEKLTKEEIAEIKNATVRHRDVMIDGQSVHMVNVVFVMKDGKAISHKLSSFNEQYPNGTEIDPKSVVFEEIMDANGVTKYPIRCSKL